MTMPTTIKELWDQGWVAENEDEAVAQAERMYDLFRGQRVAVDRLGFLWDGEWDEWFFTDAAWIDVWVEALSTESGWDGDVLYAEWDVRPADPDQVVTRSDGEKIRLGDIEARITTTPPGIGTKEGFAAKDYGLVYPEVPAACEVTAESECSDAE